MLLLRSARTGVAGSDRYTRPRARDPFYLAAEAAIYLRPAVFRTGLRALAIDCRSPRRFRPGRKDLRRALYRRQSLPIAGNRRVTRAQRRVGKVECAPKS